MLFFFSMFVSGVQGQDCVLKIGAWESYPEEATSGGRLRMRKATVRDFTSTAINRTSGKTYTGVYLLGNVYFEGIPTGLYSVTVKKAGFKTTVQDHNFSCQFASNGFDFLDVLMDAGKSTQTIRRNPNRITVRGDTSLSTTPSTSNEIPKQISGGALNGRAVSLPKPAYPPAAKVVRAEGAVDIQVLINEDGDVISAYAVSGHPLLRKAATEAARSAKFTPTIVDGSPVRVSGVITYTFVAPPKEQ
jgi:TonB family protein